MRIGSLFAGAGGLDLAVEAVFSGTVVWQAEIDKAASKVLAHRFPGVPNLGSVTDIDWATVPPVDVLCGGFPCQDVSAAGKRAGIKAGTRSGLWSVFAEAIDILRPRIVVVENVRGLLSATAHRVESDEATVGDGSGGPVLRAAGAVLGDLADLGYDAQWATVAAADVGAPHRRERVFIVATDTGNDGRSREAHYARGRAGCAGRCESGGCRTAQGSRTVVDLLPTPCARDFKDATASPGAIARNTPSLGAVEFYLPTPAAADGSRDQDYARAGRQGSGGHDLVTALALLPTPNASDASGGGQHPDKRVGHSRQLIDYALLAWGKYEPAIRRWETVLGKPAPPPTEPNKNGNPRLSAAFSEWLMGWPAGWVTDPAIGISRNDQLRIVGNGVCPQQAVAALRYLLAVTA